MKSQASHARSPLGSALGSGVAGSSGPTSRGGAQGRYGNAFLQERLRARAEGGADAAGTGLEAEGGLGADGGLEGELGAEAAPTPGVATGSAAAPGPSGGASASAGGAAPGAGAPEQGARDADVDIQGTSAANRARRQQARGRPLPVVEFSNDRPDAASQSRFHRSVVGVGERLTFSCNEEGGTWAATGGSGSVTDGLYAWQAPGAPGRYTISCTIGERVGRVAITVIAPASITARKLSDLSYGAGTQGAGMELRLTMNPTTVSFAEAEWREDPGPGLVGGYFEKFPSSAFDHAPNRDWLEMGTDNAAVIDTAAFHHWGAPWFEGHWTWVIPNRYRVAGEGAGELFTTVTQNMAIAGPSGMSTVSKLGQSSSRAPA